MLKLNSLLCGNVQILLILEIHGQPTFKDNFGHL